MTGGWGECQPDRQARTTGSPIGPDAIAAPAHDPVVACSFYNKKELDNCIGGCGNGTVLIQDGYIYDTDTGNIVGGYGECRPKPTG